MAKKSSAKSNPIVISTVSKAFEGKQVLDKVSFNVKQGSIFGLIGLNGAGKTTLIKIMLGLLTLDSGKILILGKGPESIEARKNYSYLPEKFMPSAYLKGNEFLSLALSYYHKGFDKKRAESFARALDLDPAALGKKITHYSKGMAQKLGLISAMMIDAPLLILDEPMSGLDPMARIKLKEALLKYVKEGRTIFFTSHILSDIDEICTDVAIIHNKDIVFQGSPKTFKKKFATKEKSLERAFLKAIKS